MIHLFVDRLDSPLGDLLVAHDDAGRVRALDFADHEARMRRLLRRHVGDDHLSPTPAPRDVLRAIESYFAGDLAALEGIPVQTSGTVFQERVWGALRRIPAGTTTSYGALAASLGQPTAVRAVGLANGANPVVLVLPCHRVVGADGSLTGYGGGIDRKRWLLAHERSGTPVATREPRSASA